jgi:hypothetical protein
MSTPTPQLVMTRLNVNEARSEALFASELRPADAPTAEVVAKAIDRAVQLYGVGGCAGRMAQEFAPIRARVQHEPAEVRAEQDTRGGPASPPPTASTAPRA